MIEQQGKVVAVDGERARVRLGGENGCARCDAGKGCGAGVFGRMLRRRPVVLELHNEIGAVEGQPVVVGIAEQVYLWLVTRLYLWPLLAGLLGAATGHFLVRQVGLGAAANDIAALLTGVACGSAVAVRNRRLLTEFPGKNIVHLLRTA